MPRAAMSVATSTRYFPDLNPSSASRRWPMDLLEWMSVARSPCMRRCFAILLAPCFVREKSNTEPVCSFKIVSKSESFDSFFTIYISCSIASIVVPAGATSMRTGNVMWRVAIETMALGMVAENNIVCLLPVGGICSKILCICGAKPISNMRSASSRTRTFILASVVFFSCK